MGAVTCSVRIAAPVPRVFALATDLVQMPQRIADIKRVEVLTPGPVGVGTRFRETRMMFGKEATEEMSFSVFEPDRAYTITCQSCGAVYVSAFEFVHEAGGTRVDMCFDARPVTLMARVMAPLAFFARGMVRRCVQRDLEALKRAAEGSPDGLPGSPAPAGSA
jgi:uncharacterized membrane protein